MKKLILIILTILLFTNVSYAITLNEGIEHTGKICYIRYYKYNDSNIPVFERKIGKILDIINDYELIFMDYQFNTYYIRLDKIIDIKAIREAERVW